MLFPLAGAHDALGVLAQLLGEAVDAGGDAAEHRDIEIGGDHHAHQGDILCEAARGGKRVDAVALERGQQARERFGASEIAPVLEPHAHAAAARPPLMAGRSRPCANVAGERRGRGDDREALAPELEFDQQPRERDEIIARRTQHADHHPHPFGVQAVVGAAVIEHHHPGRLRDRRSGAREAARVRAEQQVDALGTAERGIDFGAAPRVAPIVVATKREFARAAADAHAAGRVEVVDE